MRVEELVHSKRHVFLAGCQSVLYISELLVTLSHQSAARMLVNTTSVVISPKFHFNLLCLWSNAVSRSGRVLTDKLTGGVES